MKQVLRNGVLAACVLLCAALAHAGPFVVRDGRAEAEIVIAETPARMTKLAVRELQEYVRKVAGARLPIVAEPTGQYLVAVYVGKSGHTERLGVDTSDLARSAADQSFVDKVEDIHGMQE